jgi:hypothetical protein
MPAHARLPVTICTQQQQQQQRQQQQRWGKHGRNQRKLGSKLQYKERGEADKQSSTHLPRPPTSQYAGAVVT